MVLFAGGPGIRVPHPGGANGIGLLGMMGVHKLTREQVMALDEEEFATTTIQIRRRSATATATVRKKKAIPAVVVRFVWTNSKTRKKFGSCPANTNSTSLV